MQVNLITKQGVSREEISLSKLIVVGFAGRDIEKTMEHIKELEQEGIKCPKTVPVVYQCSTALLTTDDQIEVIADRTSGEVEYLILVRNGKYYIGLGSDHTDRELEAVSIHKSKQVCLKPYCPDFWAYDEIKDHFDAIKLVSTQVIDGREIAYQDGLTQDLLPLERIVAAVEKETGIADSLIFTGTVPLANGFKFGSQFACKLVDEKLNRQLALRYRVVAIPEH
ncbi:MAG: DUF2848 family protein [Sporomusaceae bacterium]|nr:DUF2848 family protein [Sporomusaceae bacterium]